MPAEVADATSYKFIICKSLYKTFYVPRLPPACEPRCRYFISRTHNYKCNQFVNIILLNSKKMSCHKKFFCYTSGEVRQLEAYKLHIKIGAHEFRGEGPEESVRRDFEEWKSF